MKRKSAGRYQVICHDFHGILSGTLEDVNERGCEMVAPSKDANPVFPKRTWIVMNILDETTGKSMNFRARLVGASLHKGYWRLRLRWQEVPALLQAVAA